MPTAYTIMLAILLLVVSVRERAAFSLQTSELSALQIAYAERGWVQLHSVVKGQKLLRLQNAADVFEKEARTAGLLKSELRNGSYFEVQSATGRKGELAAVPGLLRKVTSASKSSSEFKELKDDTVLAEVFASIANLKRIICINDQVNYKAAHIGTPFPYHQDAGFIFGKARKLFDENNGVNVVIALDLSNEANGGFEVLGGTHRTGLVDLKGRYDTSLTESSSSTFDCTLRCVPELQPGDCIVFDPMLAHGSGSNLSPFRRRLATLWYVAEP